MIDFFTEYQNTFYYVWGLLLGYQLRGSFNRIWRAGQDD